MLIKKKKIIDYKNNIWDIHFTVYANMGTEGWDSFTSVIILQLHHFSKIYTSLTHIVFL
jgi:hypothetical protein